MTVKNSKRSRKLIRTPDKGALSAARTRGKTTSASREQIQRELLLGGMARAVGEKGFGAVRVEDALELSGLSRPLAREPAIARLVAIEIRAAGAVGQERYSRTLERLGRLIAAASGRGHAGAADDVSRLVAGAVSSAIVREVSEGRAAQMERLVPELVFTVLTPCMGSERAGEEMWRVADRAAMSV